MTRRQRQTMRMLDERGGRLTLADLMTARVITMRAAWLHITEIEASGVLSRFGGEPGKPFFWSRRGRQGISAIS